MVYYWAREAKKMLKLLYQNRPGCSKLRKSTEICAEIDKKIRKNWWIIQRELSRMAGIGLATINRFVRGLEYKH